MSEEIFLPPPELFRRDVLNLGHTIIPAFVDAHDWGEFLPRVETHLVEFEYVDTSTLDAEHQVANEIATSSEELAAHVGDKRCEVVAISRRSKDRETSYPVVILYDYTDDVVHEVAVDIETRAILGITTLQSQPALSAREEERARDLVSSDGRLAERGIDTTTGSGIIVEETNFHRPSHGHRLVDLRFGPDDSRYPTAFAIVDLSAERLLRFGILFPEEES